MPEKSKPINENTYDCSDIGIMRKAIRVMFEKENPELAWALTERFGNVGGVFRATRDELMEVKGMTARAASFFSVILPVHRQAMLHELIGAKADSERMLVSLASIYFMTESRACSVCVLTDKNGSVKRIEELYDGEDIKQTVGAACRYNADRIALLRFEPDIAPQCARLSAQRIKLLKDLLFVLGAAEIGFIDEIEIYPNFYRGLRSALCGDDRIRPVTEASESVYDRNENLARLLDEYK